MALTFLYAAFYLMGVAWWAKKLRQRGTPVDRKRIYGVALLVATVGFWVYSIASSPTNVSLTVLLVGLFVSLVLGILGYAVVVHCPRWIVGKYGE